MKVGFVVVAEILSHAIDRMSKSPQKGLSGVPLNAEVGAIHRGQGPLIINMQLLSEGARRVRVVKSPFSLSPPLSPAEFD
jgi:hypothetical protein